MNANIIFGKENSYPYPQPTRQISSHPFAPTVIAL